MKTRVDRPAARRVLAAGLGAAILAAAAPAMAQSAPGPAAPQEEPQANPAQPVPAQAAAPADEAALMPDPWSRVNRHFYALSTALDHAVIAPVIHVYIHVVPPPIQTGLTNAVNNLSEPRTAANDILQGRFRHAGTAAERFAINSTVGLAGLIDVASKSGIERHESDFGETLGKYGVTSGPYIFVPLAGPSSLRDGIGQLVDIFADPIGLGVGGLNTTFGQVRAGVTVTQERANANDQLKALNGEFTDPYAAIRSAYSQQRAAQIDEARGHAPNAVQNLPDFGLEPQAPAQDQPEAQPQAPIPPESPPQPEVQPQSPRP
ncbi:MAG TPA: VacJ family lipoprotein [Caulobacteraceae bacterium]|nr:VacJ family lipoprotein [Caulobacteraceae bacterium]